jgi:ligand-binding sensor domain-containing protein
MWFGTAGGVSAFDGQNWTNYTVANGLADNEVRAIAVEETGQVWFATRSGVSEFDGQSWTTYTTAADSLASNYVQTVAVDRAGGKWFGFGERGDGVSLSASQ